MTEKHLYADKEGNILCNRSLFQLKHNGECLVLPAETEARVTAKVFRRTVTGSPRCSLAKVTSQFPYKTAPHCTVCERTDTVLKAKNENQILTKYCLVHYFLPLFKVM